MMSTALQASVMLVLAAPVHSQPAPNTHPTGGTVVAGSAAISRTTSNTQINQSTQRAAIDWRSFDVGSQQSVTFNQPSTSAVALNRVAGPDPSQIAGRIDANGQIILVNQSGVNFYKGAQVNTAGLVVTTANVTNQNFMAGNMKFDQPGNPNAKIDNQGNITIKQAGLAALVAPQVANSGTITAKLGHVVLAGAKTATLDLYGDGLLSLDVTNQVAQAPIGPDGKAATALVTNTGVIIADGGTVQLTARAADGIVQNLVQAGGTIRAATMGDKTGVVALNGVGGSIVVEGQLAAPGSAPGTKGGAIEVVSNHDVTVASTAKLDASGKAGGGVVAIGTTLARAKGGPSVTPTITAANTTIKTGATITADAMANGDGGRVTVLSTNTTHMDGLITAKGGPQGGNGGFVEVSGPNLGMTGMVDVSAPSGALGTILLDPDFLTVVSGSAGSGSQDPTFVVNGGTVLASDPSVGSDTISNGIINAFAGNVLLQANKTLTVAAQISLTSFPSQNLTLEAGGTLTVNSGIAITASGNVILATGGAGPNSPPTAQPNPLISLLGTVGSTGGSVSLLAGKGGTVDIGAAGLISVPTAGKLATLQMDTLSIASGGKVSAPLGTIEIAPASTIAVSIGTGAGLQLPQATLSAMKTNMLRVGGATIDGTLVQTATSIAISGTTDLAGISSTLDLQSSGLVIESPLDRLNNIGTLTGKSGFVNLAGGLDPGFSVGNYTVTSGGDFDVVTTTDTGISGTLSASNVSFNVVNGSTLNVAGTVAATRFVSLSAEAIKFGAISNTQGTEIALTSTQINLAGNAVLGKAGQTKVLDVSVISGIAGVTEVPTATINTGTLQTGSGVHGPVSLLGTTNAVANVGSFAVSGGDFQLVNNGTLQVIGAVKANNIFIENRPVGLDKTLSFASTGSLTAANGGTISLVTDLLSVTAGASITATAGTVEIAPFTPATAIGVSGGGQLQIGTTELAAITTGTLRLGGYEDVTNGGSNTVTAGAIDIGGLTDLQAGHTIAPTLRLDAKGPITESVGPLQNVGTLAASTNSAAGSVVLDNPANTIATLGNVAVANGDFALTNNTGLALPGGSTVYANNVTITNAGTVSIGGNLAATTGSLQVSALGSASDVTVSGTALIGAGTSATIAAGSNFTQSGGIIDAPTLTIEAGDDGKNPPTPSRDFVQLGGTIAALSTAPGVGLTISATGTLTQTGASSAITSNDDISVTGTAGINLANGSLIAVGNLTMATAGDFVSGGTAAAGNALTLQGILGVGPTSVTQTAGLIGAGGVLQLATTGQAMQVAGTVAAANPQITGATAGSRAFQTFSGPITVLPGSTSVSLVKSGADTPTAPPGPPSATLTLPSVLPASGHPHHLVINYSGSDYVFDSTLNADWVEINTPNNSTVENPGGSVVAGLLTGTAGVDALFQQPGNQVDFLAAGVPITGGGGVGGNINYITGGNLILRDDLPAKLAIAGLVQAGTDAASDHHTLDLIAQGLTIDHSATSIATVPGLTFLANGSLVATGSQSVVGGTTIVTPGKILLQADTITALPAIAGTILVNAPDGMVEIAPRSSSFSISIDPSVSSAASNLSLTETFLQQINTLGITAGTAGTQTLVLGSVDDGATSLATAININAGVVLTAFDRTLQLNAIGSVQEGANGVTVTALTGKVGDLLLQTDTNAISELGNVVDRNALGQHYQSAAALTGLTSGHDVKLNDTGTTALTVVGTVTAGNALTQQGTIDLLAPSTTIDSLTRIATAGTADNLGSLIANAFGTTISGTTTIFPGAILLQTDNLSIASTGTAAIVTAPSGLVAIAPISVGRTISVDSTAAPGGSVLSLGTQDLDLIDTVSGTLLTGVTPGPVGTQTLALGSVDGGVTRTAGAIGISPGVTLNLGNVANTLAVYSMGDVTENPLGAGPSSAIAVNTLIGTVTAGNIYLNGNNRFTNLGNLAIRSGKTTPGGTNADLLATSGNILIKNTQSLQVVTNTQASAGAGQYAEIDVVGAGPNGDLTVLNGGTVQASSVFLRAGNEATPGNVNVQGSVLALVEADVAAGVQYTPAAPSIPPSIIYGPGASAGAIDIPGLIDVTPGTAQLAAAGGITETGTIRAGLLTGFSKTNAAYLSGNGNPTSNRITNLGTFNTATGFLLRDSESLAVVGPVVDKLPVTIAVAPPGGGPGGYGIGNLVLAGTVEDLSGTVKLEATGNVYEIPAGTTIGTYMDFNGTHTLVATGGVVNAGTLVSQAGAIPDTETSVPAMNAPGTVPGSPVSLAFDFFGNANAVHTLGNVTATGDFLLNNGQDLTVLGTVLAGAALQNSIPVAGTTFPVMPGAFGTLPHQLPPPFVPFAEIDVVRAGTATSGNLLVGSTGIIHAGLDGTLTGNVTLSAGKDTVPGAVAVNGALFAANAGTVSVSAGFNPNTLTFDPCGPSACMITINGAMWGDQTGLTPALASLVDLRAASSIEEGSGLTIQGAIGAVRLQGEALYHAWLMGAGATITTTANQINNLGSFDTNRAGSSDPVGFQLRDGRTLVVDQPVTDHGTTSSLVSIAVAPMPTTSSYSAGNLTLATTITANPDHGTVKLQATGNVSETTGGTIRAATLISQAGAIPDTEGAAGNMPGQTPTSAKVVSSGSVALGNVNQLGFLSVSNLGTLGPSTATGDFLLINGQDLVVAGTVLAGAGSSFDLTKSVAITTQAGAGTAGNLTIAAGSLIEAGANVALNAPGTITNNATVTALNNNAVLTASGNINNNGLVFAVTNNASLNAGGSINNPGSVNAGQNAMLTAPGDINNFGLVSASSNDATLSAGGSINNPGSVNVGQNATLTASGNINTNGLVFAVTNSASLNAGGSINNPGSVNAGQNATLTAPGDINNFGLVSASSNDATLSAGGSINNPGNVNAGHDARLTAGGNINTSGDIAAGHYALLTAGANISQTAGLINAAGAGLAGSPSVGLTATGGSINQNSGAAISATNAIAPVIALTAGGGIAFGGTIATSGALGAAGGTSLTANGGDITETAPGAASPTGVLKTFTLTGSATGKAAFNTASGNQVVQLGPFATGSGDFTLIDSESLTITGALNVVGGSAAITTLNGTDLFGNPSLGDLTINTGAPITATQNVVLSSQHSILNQDAVAAGSNVTFSASQDIGNANVTAGGTANLSAGGSINQNTGAVSAANAIGLLAATGTISEAPTGTIQVSNPAGQIALTAQSDITVNGSVTAPDSSGSTSVVNVQSIAGGISDNGAIRGSAVTLNAAGNILIPGLLADAGTVTLFSGGSISEPGTLIATLLTGNSAGDAALTGSALFSNRVAQLGSFSSGGTFTLDDGTGLTILGPLSAPKIIIDTSVNAITLADQAVITTGGIERPSGTITVSNRPNALTTNGAYLTTGGGFTQQGTSTILGIGGGPNILSITAQGAANITFDPVAGLQGKSTWLILDVTSGTISGQISVKNLDVFRNGQAGSANLTGTVTGLTGPAAAGASHIQPSPNSNFRINGCPIQSVTCVLLPTESVPVANPLNDIDIGTLSNPNEDQDLLLPIVSDQDY